MEAFMAVALTVLGAVLGAAALWLVTRKAPEEAAEQARQQALAEAEAARAVVDERLAMAEAVRVELRGELEQAQEKASGLSVRLSEESQRRATAEARGERVAVLEADLARTTEENSSMAKRLADLSARMEEERKAAEEKLELVGQARTALADHFKALSSEALKSNNQSFLELARASMEKFQEAARTDLQTRQKSINEVLKPVGEALGRVDQKIMALEKERHTAYQGLMQQVQSLGQGQTELRGETARLVTALRKPHVRGRWGEVQLRRVVEMAGMTPNCDFTEQTSVDSDDGRLRPDLMVNLPGGRHLVVDAKAPLDAYLNSLEAQDQETRAAALHKHSVQIRQHMASLGSKAYWDQFESAPDFVVMFLPGETFFSAALEQNPALIEEGAAKRVIIASPTTLIAMLKAVAYGWQQEKMAQSAMEMGALGKELYDRLSVLAEHFSKVGKGLKSATDNYNKTVSSLESRVLVAARKFKDLGVGSKKDISQPAQVESMPRSLQVPEMAAETKPKAALDDSGDDRDS